MAYMIKNSETRKTNKVSRTIITIKTLYYFKSSFISSTDYDTKKIEPSKKEQHTHSIFCKLKLFFQYSLPLHMFNSLRVLYTSSNSHQKQAGDDSDTNNGYGGNDRSNAN